MVKAFEAELKELVRGLLEALRREERAMYLETHPTSANGYYTRDLLTLVGRWRTSKFPAYGKAISIQGIYGAFYSPQSISRLIQVTEEDKPIRRYLYTTNLLGRLAKEVKRRTKVVEVFCDEGAVENLLYLVLSHLDEAWGARRLRGFAEIQIGKYHVALTQ
jgi:hypothetical protein